MNLVELTQVLIDTAKRIRTVHSVFKGDVYTNWNSSEVKYGSINIGLEQVQTEGTDMMAYSFVLYYADRLLQDNTNEYQIYDDALTNLQSIVNTLNMIEDVFIEDEIIYKPFNQKFMDNLAGMYCTVRIKVPSELAACGIDDFDEDE